MPVSRNYLWNLKEIIWKWGQGMIRALNGCVPGCGRVRVSRQISITFLNFSLRKKIIPETDLSRYHCGFWEHHPAEKSLIGLSLLWLGAFHPTKNETSNTCDCLTESAIKSHSRQSRLLTQLLNRGKKVNLTGQIKRNPPLIITLLAVVMLVSTSVLISCSYTKNTSPDAPKKYRTKEEKKRWRKKIHSLDNCSAFIRGGHFRQRNSCVTYYFFFAFSIMLEYIFEENR